MTSTLRRGSGISHHLVVSAQDGQGLRSEQNAHVYVSVLSERQRPPVFVSPRYVFAVREDIVPRSVIGNVTAKTADQGLQGIRYAIRSGNDEGYFAIDAIRGLISVEKPLDFESASSVLLSVQAASGIPLAFGHAQVRLLLLINKHVTLKILGSDAEDRTDSELLKNERLTEPKKPAHRSNALS